MTISRIAFAGTPSFAKTTLNGIASSDMDIVCVITQPDRRMGRGQTPQASPVKKLAEQLGLKVWQPESFATESTRKTLEAMRLDLLIVSAYGLILPKEVLSVPKYGCINVHASLLPRWRGAAPIERAIIEGDSTTGVSIMQMVEELDAGPVYLKSACSIGKKTHAAQLEEILAKNGAKLLLETLEDFDSLVPSPQSANDASYAKKITRADAAINLSDNAALIERYVRALSHRMPPFIAIGGTRLLIVEAEALPQTSGNPPCGLITQADATGIYVSCKASTLKITRLRLNKGKGNPLTPQEALNGYASLFEPGTSLAAYE